MKRIGLMALLVIASVARVDGAVVVKNVVAQQRYPWNGLVDIVVTLEGTANDVADSYCTFAATNGTTGTGIIVSHIARNGADMGSNISWTRRFVWDAAADMGAVKIDDLALTVDAVDGGVQLWENGPYWAKCNVGASKPEEYGYYFWWGDTVGYKRNASNDGWVSSKNGMAFTFSSGNCPTYRKSNSALLLDGYIDSTGNLVVAHDAAMAHLGTPWRMPTDAEMNTLISSCTTTWTTRNGVYGRLVTGKGAYATKSIFLPAARGGFGSGLDDFGLEGCYWTSTPNSCGSDYEWSWYLRYGSDNFDCDYCLRYLGQSVRPLREFAQ